MVQLRIKVFNLKKIYCLQMHIPFLLCFSLILGSSLFPQGNNLSCRMLLFFCLLHVRGLGASAFRVDHVYNSDNSADNLIGILFLDNLGHVISFLVALELALEHFLVNWHVVVPL